MEVYGTHLSGSSAACPGGLDPDLSYSILCREARQAHRGGVGVGGSASDFVKGSGTGMVDCECCAGARVQAAAPAHTGEEGL
jgi:hypothetical protein